MKKDFSIPYGKTNLHFSLSESNFLGCIDIPEFPGVADIEQAILAALRNPIEHPPLSEWVRGAGKVVVTCPDITREVQARLYLPVLFAELNRAGITDDRIELCFALGNHRELTVPEMEGIAGASILERVTYFQSQGQRTEDFRLIGHTERSTPVWFNKRVLAADRIIITGGVVYHIFAGFGGGRKGLLPGIARLDTIMANHSFMLAPQEGAGMNPNCTTGILEGNPIHEDMLDAAVRVPNVFLLNTVLNVEKEIAGVFAGDLRRAHVPATDLVRSRFGIPIRERADFVIFSPGGFPRDNSFYQAFLSLERAARAVRPGGVIVLVAECPEGTGEEDRFRRWFELDDRLCVEREMRRDFDNVGLIAHDMHRFAKILRVIAVTGMGEQDVKTLLMESAPSLDEALDRAFRQLGPDAKGYVMPRGSYTVPVDMRA
jgi:lactate racemase